MGAALALMPFGYSKLPGKFRLVLFTLRYNYAGDAKALLQQGAEKTFASAGTNDPAKD